MLVLLAGEKADTRNYTVNAYGYAGVSIKDLSESLRNRRSPSQADL